MLGTAIGDSGGLPWEGLRGRKRQGPLPETPLRGFTSDDTEQTVLLAEALLLGSDLDSTLQHFRSGLRRWMLGLPLGIGFGTLLAGLRLLAGVPPQRSGVRSAGNGAAMRAALLGLVLPEEQLLTWVDAISQVTHTHPIAIDGARLTAVAARIAAYAGPSKKKIRAQQLTTVVSEDEMRRAVALAIEAARTNEDPQILLHALGIPGFVSGYAAHTVPVAIFLWLRYHDAETAIRTAVSLGGDVDSVAAIASALHGATTGASALPAERILALRDDAVGPTRLRALARALASKVRGESPALSPSRWGMWVVRTVALGPRLLGWLLWRRFAR